MLLVVVVQAELDRRGQPRLELLVQILFNWVQQAAVAADRVQLMLAAQVVLAVLRQAEVVVEALLITASLQLVVQVEMGKPLS